MCLYVCMYVRVHACMYVCVYALQIFIHKMQVVSAVLVYQWTCLLYDIMHAFDARLIIPVSCINITLCSFPWPKHLLVGFTELLHFHSDTDATAYIHLGLARPYIHILNVGIVGSMHSSCMTKTSYPIQGANFHVQYVRTKIKNENMCSTNF